MQIQGEMSGEQIMDEEFDMDLEYLRMIFPGLSNDSVLDVYMANNRDLEATIDMLNQLEVNLAYLYFIIYITWLSEWSCWIRFLYYFHLECFLYY